MKNSTILCSFLLACSIFSYASENADENTRINAAPELHALTPSKDFEINLQATIAEQERALEKKDKELEKHRPTLEKTTLRVLNYVFIFSIALCLGMNIAEKTNNIARVKQDQSLLYGELLQANQRLNELRCDNRIQAKMGENILTKMAMLESFIRAIYKQTST